MIEIKHIITEELGIHARPALKLVKELSKYQSSVKLKAKNKIADANKIMEIMSLVLKRGDELTIYLEGSDEENAAESLKTFLQHNL